MRLTSAQIGCVWFYRPQEAFDAMNKRVANVHPKEIFFSVHFDEPGLAKSVLLRRVRDMAFFPSVPDWNDPAIARAVNGIGRDAAFTCG